MFKLVKVLNTPLIRNKLMTAGSRVFSRCIYDINFDGEEEIIENVLGEVMTIGINLPDSKNLLTESALHKLCNCIENFESDEKISVAVLHGSGGNFCTGVVPGEKALMLSQGLLKRLNELRKPIIGSLNGYATNFGLFLAIMCDIRIMDAAGHAGFSNKVEDFEFPSFIYERLLLTVGLSNTLELICSRQTWPADRCLKLQFISNIVGLGCSLGQSILLAQNMAFHRPLNSVKKDRSRIFSFLSTKQ